MTHKGGVILLVRVVSLDEGCRRAEGRAAQAG
ncbi:hypothetical protein ACVW19_001640 [Streptomyces sp. TE5632]